MFKLDSPASQFNSRCCELEEEWNAHGLAEVELAVEAALLRYQKIADKLMRQQALSQLQMMTRLMVV
jgi:hypothetical protein